MKKDYAMSWYLLPFVLVVYFFILLVGIVRMVFNK
jgi:hypothetical protein